MVGRFVVGVNHVEQLFVEGIRINRVNWAVGAVVLAVLRRILVGMAYLLRGIHRHRVSAVEGVVRIALFTFILISVLGFVSFLGRSFFF